MDDRLWSPGIERTSIFLVVWGMAFFARNAVAKNEKNMSPDINSKIGGDVPGQKSRG